MAPKRKAEKRCIRNITISLQIVNFSCYLFYDHCFRSLNRKLQHFEKTGYMSRRHTGDLLPLLQCSLLLSKHRRSVSVHSSVWGLHGSGGSDKSIFKTAVLCVAYASAALNDLLFSIQVLSWGWWTPLVPFQNDRTNSSLVRASVALESYGN